MVYVAVGQSDGADVSVFHPLMRVGMVASFNKVIYGTTHKLRLRVLSKTHATIEILEGIPFKTEGSSLSALAVSTLRHFNSSRKAMSGTVFFRDVINALQKSRALGALASMASGGGAAVAAAPPPVFSFKRKAKAPPVGVPPPPTSAARSDTHSHILKHSVAAPSGSSGGGATAAAPAGFGVEGLREVRAVNANLTPDERVDKLIETLKEFDERKQQESGASAADAIAAKPLCKCTEVSDIPHLLEHGHPNLRDPEIILKVMLLANERYFPVGSPEVKVFADGTGHFFGRIMNPAMEWEHVLDKDKEWVERYIRPIIASVLHIKPKHDFNKKLAQRTGFDDATELLWVGRAHLLNLYGESESE